MKNPPDYESLYQIAEGQAGFFTSGQAHDCGFSCERLSNSVKSKKFERIERGVYRFNHFPSSPFADLFIALLKSGPRSTLSHQTALSIYGLSDFLPGEIHVTLPRSASRRREGIRYHTKSITEDEITRYEGLRVATVERTLVDLFESGFDSHQLRLAAEQSFNRGLTTPKFLVQALDKRGASSRKEFESLLGIALQ